MVIDQSKFMFPSTLVALTPFVRDYGIYVDYGYGYSIVFLLTFVHDHTCLFHNRIIARITFLLSKNY